MKKVITLLLLMLLLLTLFGCSSGTTKIEKSDSNNKTNEIIKVDNNKDETAEGNVTNQVETKPAFDAEAIAQQISINEYKYDSGYWRYHFIEITNNSDQTVDVGVNILYYDSSDNLISAESASEDVVESGYSVLLSTMPDEDWSRTEIELEVNEPRYYSPVQSDIECTVTPAKQKLVVQAKNIGNEPADFVQITALFFKGEEVVGYDWTYFTDNDSQIKPGKTISENLEIYDDFDGYKYYVTGRR